MIVDTAEHVGEPGFGIDIIQFCRSDERVDRRCPFAAAVRAAEGPVAAAERDTAQRPLGGIIRETDAAIVKEAGEGVPTLQHVIHCLGYGTWQAYDNHYWPADYVVDQKGKIVANFFGEGDYDKIEDKIRSLISAGPAVAEDNGQDLSKIGSPEMYFGTLRTENLASPEQPSNNAQAYTAPSDLPLNKFALVGNWAISMESAALRQDDGKVRLHFKAGKVHMVAGSAQPVTVAVTVDGKQQPPVTVQGSQLYTLFDSNDYGEHELELKIPKAGFNVYTFTFG